MKLSYEQIKEVTCGAERIGFEDGEYRFFRFNDREIEFYKTSEFYTKVYATSDVEMSFETDAAALLLKGTARVAVSYRTWYTLEVFSDGERIGTIQNFDGEMNFDKLFAEFPLGEFDARFNLGEGKKKVRIVFPQFASLALSDVELIGATYLKPLKPEKKMFFYGDSITHGYDAQYPSNKYTALVAHALGVEGYNKAIGGEVFQPALAAVKSENEPDFISVAYGTNDCGSTRAVFLENSRAFYENLSRNYPNAKIFALSPIWRANYSDKQTVGDFFDVEEQIKKIAASLPNVIFVPGFDFVPHDTKYFYDGHLHPSDEGFEIYAENLVKAIKKYFD
ncbi:MAG: SGNH/GDSL hydrolase family protein [Ruminococcaceae bacterium]|nr:SGNH/GDSL hydrolase family protein [Oscillospiraceae bacterium]